MWVEVNLTLGITLIFSIFREKKWSTQHFCMYYCKKNNFNKDHFYQTIIATVQDSCFLDFSPFNLCTYKTMPNVFSCLFLVLFDLNCFGTFVIE